MSRQESAQVFGRLRRRPGLLIFELCHCGHLSIGSRRRPDFLSIALLRLYMRIWSNPGKSRA